MTPIKYQLVSEAVVLRDYQAPKYLNEEHKRLVDIADCLYNANIPVSEWNDNPEYDYKALYARYGEEYWKKVLKDISALDSQLNHYNVGELAEEYQEMLEEGKE